jgi:two-component system LytT family response regulator
MKVAIIDDDPMARKDLKLKLSLFNDIQVVAEAMNAEMGRRMITEWQPELIFLDINMPGEDGFQLLDSLSRPVETIFVTSHDEYAVHAFERDAVDYLLKPVDEKRLSQAITKVSRRLERRRPDDRYHSHKYYIKDGKNAWIVRLSSIRMIESDGNYVRIFYDKQSPMIKKTLKEFEDTLPAEVFFKANRSTIINRDYIVSVENVGNACLRITLKEGHVVKLPRLNSRLFKESVSRSSPTSGQ